MPAQKELHYFVDTLNWRRGSPWYEDHFREAMACQVVGEASPSYTNFPQWEGVPRRIKHLLPEVRLIYVLRDPIDRMKSHYRHEMIMGREHSSPDTAFATNSSYFFRSCYFLQLEQYFECFRRDQVFMLTTDSLKTRRDQVLQELFSFLGVAPVDLSEQLDLTFHRSADKKRRRRGVAALASSSVYYHLASRAPPSVKTPLRRLTYRRVDVPEVHLSPSIESELREAFRHDVGKLAAHMPEDFDGWGLL